MHCAPNRSAPSRIKSGFCTAAVLTEILSAPAFKIARTSSTVRTPPPTVNGMKTRSATRRTMSATISRRSDEAVMSRKTNSSAPSLSYLAPCSTGSPASTRLTKLMPLTTRPRSTSRQGMMRLASIFDRGLRQGLATETQSHRVNQRRVAFIFPFSSLRLCGSVANLRNQLQTDLHHRNHAGRFRQLVERRGVERAVDLVDRHRPAPGLVAAQIKLRDVDVVVAQERADAADYARPVVVAHDEHVALRRGLQAVRIDRDDALFRAPEERAGDPALVLFVADDDLDQAGEVLRSAGFRFRDAQAALFGDHRGVDLIDSRADLSEQAGQNRLSDRAHVEVGHFAAVID